jgi:hypothetical protein
VADVTDGGDEIGVCVGLQHVAKRYTLESLARDCFAKVHGENDDLRVGAFRSDRGGNFEPVHIRHSEIQKQKIGAVLSYVFDGFRARTGFRGDFDVRFELEDRADGAPDDAMVVGDSDAVALGRRKVRDLGLGCWRVIVSCDFGSTWRC